MQGMVEKGIILSVKENTAQVSPLNDNQIVSNYLQVQDGIQGLKKGDHVAYVIFNDFTGLIFSKLN